MHEVVSNARIERYICENLVSAGSNVAPAALRMCGRSNCVLRRKGTMYSDNILFGVFGFGWFC